MNLAGILHHGVFPDVAVVQPAVRHFYLLTVHDLLPEQTVLISDGTSHSRQVQAAQTVHKACSQSAQTAVAQTGFRFFLQYVLDINSQLAQRIRVFLRGEQVKHVAVHAAAHQELDAQIIKPLSFGAFSLFPANNRLLHDLIANGGGHCAINLLRRRFLNGSAVIPLNFPNDGLFYGFLVEFRGWHTLPPRIDFRPTVTYTLYYIMFSQSLAR